MKIILYVTALLLCNAGFVYSIALLKIPRFSLSGLPYLGIDTLPNGVKAEITLLPVEGKAEISGLRSRKDTPELKYIAIGGRLSAGYRDGGLFRQGQVTAYPNLIAHQMGLKSFTSPLFTISQGNGTGFLDIIQEGKYPNWKSVESNTAVLSKKPLKIAKYNGSIPDNLSFPEGPIFVSQMPQNYETLYPDQKEYISYYNRILTENQEDRTNLLDLLKEKSPEFCTFETHFDEFLGIANNPVNLTTNFLFSQLDENVLDQHLITLISSGTKLVLFTIPQVLDFPYFHIFDINELLSRNESIFIRYKNNHINPIKADTETLLLPNESVRNVFLEKSSQGLSFEDPLMDQDVISADEIREMRFGLPSYNQFYVLRPAKKHNLPVVDLEGIYKRIIANEYISDDQVSISGSYPEGDFFSTDGKSPSAVGQAIIANETIKVINKHYGTKIPLISIRKFKEVVNK